MAFVLHRLGPIVCDICSAKEESVEPRVTWRVDLNDGSLNWGGYRRIRGGGKRKLDL